MPSAGDIIRASDVARTIHEAACTSSLTLTTGAQDVTGCTVTFTTSKANVECVVVGVGDIDHGVTGGGLARVILNVDGVDQSALILCDDDGSGSLRETNAQVWNPTLASAGSHTLKFTARKTIAAGTVSVGLTHTRFVATVYDVTS